MLRLLSQTHWCVARRRLLIAGDGRRVNKIRICLLVSTEYTNVTDRRTPRDGIITPCNVARSDIDFARWLHPQCGMWLWNHDSEFTKWQHPAISAMWHVTLGLWHWIRQVTAPCIVACGCGNMTVNSPSGITLQCDTWLWDDMPLNSPERPPYWNSTSGFDFGHITAVVMSFCTSLRNFIQIGPPSAVKSCRFSRWRISAICDFRGPIMGSLKAPCTTSYRLSIDTIALNCLLAASKFCCYGSRAIWAKEKRTKRVNKM